MSVLFASWLAGLRALRRDWRSGELRLLATALLTAVVAVSSVAFLADRVGQALIRDSAQMLGGDLVIESGEPLPGHFLRHAHDLGLDAARTLEFPSMVTHGDDAQLVAVKAVSSGYPLRGQLQLQSGSADRQDLRPADTGPARGTVWVDPQLPALTELGLGSDLMLGDSTFQVAALIAYESDRSLRFVNVAPRVLMAMDDVDGTGLVGPHSRVTHRLLLAGSAQAVQAYQDWLKSRLEPGQRLSTLENASPELQRTLDRARHFLALVALLTVMLAGVAVALAARRYCIRHQDGVAVMRCLGVAARTLVTMVLVQFVALALVTAAVGIALGFSLHFGLVALVTEWFGVELPASSWAPVMHGVATALLLVLGFAVPALLALRTIPPMRVLRAADTQLASYRRSGVAFGLLASLALVFGLAGNWRLGASLALGFAIACGLFVIMALLTVTLLSRLRPFLASWPFLRFVLAGMARRRALAVMQLCALSMGLAILMLLAMTRTDLLQGWQNTVPANAPNTFLINIQPDQREAVMAFLKQAGFDEVALTPMVRARLVAINDEAVSPDRYDNERARSMVTREFNLSYQDRLPDSNRLVQGRWLQADQPHVSLETGLARTLGIQTGDRLSFDIAGQQHHVDVVGLREVKWDSFEVNFFALVSASVLAQAPATYITSFYLPPESGAFLRGLLDGFPNITVFDIAALLAQVQAVLDQVVLAVQLLFLFTLAAGLVVLSTALLATRDERIHEVALMRALGASAGQLSAALRLELVLLGVLSGLLASATAQGVAWLLAHYVIEFDLQASVWPWLAGPAIGVVLAWLSGRLVLSGLLDTPPMVSLRNAW